MTILDAPPSPSRKTTMPTSSIDPAALFSHSGTLTRIDTPAGAYVTDGRVSVLAQHLAGTPTQVRDGDPQVAPVTPEQQPPLSELLIRASVIHQAHVAGLTIHSTPGDLTAHLYCGAQHVGHVVPAAVSRLIDPTGAYVHPDQHEFLSTLVAYWNAEGWPTSDPIIDPFDTAATLLHAEAAIRRATALMRLNPPEPTRSAGLVGTGADWEPLDMDDVSEVRDPADQYAHLTAPAEALDVHGDRWQQTSSDPQVWECIAATPGSRCAPGDHVHVLALREHGPFTDPYTHTPLTI